MVTGKTLLGIALTIGVIFLIGFHRDSQTDGASERLKTVAGSAKRAKHSNSNFDQRSDRFIHHYCDHAQQ
jgi:hypothetical protein